MALISSWVVAYIVRDITVRGMARQLAALHSEAKSAQGAACPHAPVSPQLKTLRSGIRCLITCYTHSLSGSLRR